jgi:hypothetical protein
VSDQGGSGLIASVSEKLIRALPPAFLLICLLNIVFIGLSAWIYDHNSTARAVLLTKIVDACLIQRKSEPP